MRSRIVATAILMTAVACTPREERIGTDTTQVMATGATRLSVTSGFHTPESVRYDVDLDQFFVANINGNPSVADNNGYIARIRGDSTNVVTMLAEGGKLGVTLHAPKGMTIVGDTLWVADIDALRGFNKRTGAPVATISLAPQRATFLNDVVLAGDGAIYVTDSGIRFDESGGMSHPGEDRIFRIAGRAVTVAARGDKLSRPNGIAWDGRNNRFVLAPFGGRHMQAWTAGDTAPQLIASGAGQYDGVEILDDGRILVSSWADSAVHIMSNGGMTVLVGSISAPADIGVDSKRGVLAIPRFDDGAVEFWKLPLTPPPVAP